MSLMNLRIQHKFLWKQITTSPENHDYSIRGGVSRPGVSSNVLMNSPFSVLKYGFLGQLFSSL
jgi:hypothetical protein